MVSDEVRKFFECGSSMSLPGEEEGTEEEGTESAQRIRCQSGSLALSQSRQETCGDETMGQRQGC